MSMTAEIEKRFNRFLDDGWDLEEIGPFLRSYLRLLLPYHSELQANMLAVLMERQKQMKGEGFDGSEYDSVRKLCKSSIDNNLQKGDCSSRESALNRMVFCAMSDSTESDTFYLSEPIFEFANLMEIRNDSLTEILCTEFPDFQL